MPEVELNAASSHPEFLDEVMADACGRFSGKGLPVAATLLLELHGSRHSLAEQQQQMGMAWIGRRRGCLGLGAMIHTWG